MPAAAESVFLAQRRGLLTAVTLAEISDRKALNLIKVWKLNTWTLANY